MADFQALLKFLVDSGLPPVLISFVFVFGWLGWLFGKGILKGIELLCLTLKEMHESIKDGSSNQRVLGEKLENLSDKLSNEFSKMVDAIVSRKISV